MAKGAKVEWGQERFGLFTCEGCEHEWQDDLPALWTFLEVWPKCCGAHANLIEPLWEKTVAL
jgi:hypothetical protein